MKQLDFFLNSWKKINTRTPLVIVADALFLLIAGVISYGFLQLIAFKAERVDLNTNILELGQFGAEQLAKELIYFIIFAVLGFTTYVVLMAAIVTLFKGYAWHVTNASKPTLSFFKRLLLQNLAFFLSIAVLLVILNFLVSPMALPLYLLAIGVIALYFGMLLHGLAVTGSKRPFIESFKKGFSKINVTGIPFLIIVALYTLLAKLLQLFHIPFNTIIVLLTIVYASWARYYFMEAIKAL